MTCQNCGKPLEGRNPRQRFCGGRCRAEASRRRREQALVAALEEAERSLARARTQLMRQERRG